MNHNPEIYFRHDLESKCAIVQGVLQGHLGVFESAAKAGLALQGCFLGKELKLVWCQPYCQYKTENQLSSELHQASEHPT